MVTKSERTMELYKQVGAEARLLKALLTTFAVDSSKITYAKDSDRLSKNIREIEEMISGMEDQMFRDHPSLSNEYINVFYGTVSEEKQPLNSVDKEIRIIAEKTAKKLFDKAE
jgi:hypothetical protein